MDIQVVEPEFCKLNVKYEIDGEDVSNKRDEVVRKFKNHKMPGFRQGHASMQAIKIFYKKEIEQELTKELAQDAVQNVVSERKIRPFGRPNFSSANFVSDNKFVCEFEMWKQPDFELGQYKDFEIPKLPKEKDIQTLTQEMLQELRKKFGEENPYTEDDFVQLDDKIILDYSALFNGVNDPKLTATGVLLKPCDILIPGFAENLLGMKMGETRVFELKIPDTFATENAGNVLQFTATIQMGSKIIPLTLDDELAKKAGVETMDKLMEELGSISATKINQLEATHINDQIARRLVSTHNFQVPSWIVLVEAQLNSQKSGLEWSSVKDEMKEQLLKSAEDSIKLSLILEKIREIEPDTQLTDEEVYKIAYENISKHSPDPAKSVEELYKNGQLPLLFSRIRDEYTVIFLAKTCKIVE